MNRPTTPEQARDEIAAMLIDAGTECATQAAKKSRLSANRKLLLRLSERLTDIGERIATLTY